MAWERPKRGIRRYVRRHWQSPAFALPAHAARRYLDLYRNNEHQMAVNGEAEVVRRLAEVGIRQALDVGMHLGLWTDLVIAHHPHARVDGFEASPSKFAALRERYRSHADVHVVGVALGSSPGRAVLHENVDDASTSSLLDLPGTTTVPVEVEVMTGDDYLRSVDLQHVDYLKVDVEGFDFAVLEGFSGALGGAAIDALQFEYNHFNITARRLLADFYDLLDPLGYAIGKVHPGGVAFGPYRWTDEDWVGPSCVAVHRSRPEVVELLRSA